MSVSRGALGQNGEMSIGITRGTRAPGQSLMSKREQFHLAYRLAGRSFQLLIARSSRTPGRHVAGAAICAVGDIASAIALRRSDRFALGPRLAIDSLDSALWSQGTTGLELATMPGVPLAIEAGLRIGLAGVIVPAMNATVTGCIRRLRNRPISSGSFRYQVMAVALGAGIASYEANRRRVTIARHDQGLEARIGAAHLAGQNDVATGADTVVDLLSRTTPLLSSGSGSATVGRMLADWRQSLAASTAEHATYLGIALAKWRRRHNDLHHDLVADISFKLEEGDGTILLSRDQAAWLEFALDGLDLKGTVAVRAVDRDEVRQPNRPRRLVVDDIVLDVPADPRPGLIPFDVGPLGFLASSMWFADTLVPGECEPRAWAVGPIAAAGPILALWAHREVARRGDRAQARVLFVALGHSLLHAVASTGTMRNFRNPEGIQRFPFLGGINMIAMMLPLYWFDLDATQRMVAIAAIAAILSIGIMLFPEPVDWSHFIAELLWPAAASFSMSAIRTQLAVDATTLKDALEDAAEDTLANAFADGRSYVLGLASETRYAAHRDFAAVRDQLDERISVEVERRLHEVDKQLEELTCASES
jgi:hypothetical protein